MASRFKRTLLLVICGVAAVSGHLFGETLFRATNGMTIYNGMVFESSADRFDASLGTPYENGIVRLETDSYVLPGEKDGATAAIWIYDDVTLDLNGSTIQGDHTASVQAIYAVSGTAATVQNGTIRGYHWLVRVFTPNFHLQNLIFEDYDYTGILGYAPGLAITACTFQDGGQAVNITEPGATITGSTFDGVEGIHIGANIHNDQPASNPGISTIRDNSFIAGPDIPYGDAIFVYTAPDHRVIVEGNEFDGFYNPIDPYGLTRNAFDIVISGNTFRQCSSPIRTGLGSYELVGNDIYDSYDSVKISAAGTLTVRDNNFHSTGRYHIVDDTSVETDLRENYWGSTGRIVVESFISKPSGAYLLEPVYDSPAPGGTLIALTNDGDGDGVEDSIDNCPFIANAGQSDIDNDAIGDPCDDVDSDGDGYNGPEDCDDSDHYRNPEAAEILNDDVDMNCDGAADHFALLLEEGWNLAFMPIEADPVTLSHLTSFWDLKSVLQYDNAGGGWLRYDAQFPDLASLDMFDLTLPFWIEMNSADTMQDQVPFADDRSFHLSAGWNLIGYPWTESNTIADALGNALSDITAIHSFQNGEWVYWLENEPGAADGLKQLEPGRGYWIHAKRAGELSFAGGRAQ